LPDLIIKTGLCHYILENKTEILQLVRHFQNILPVPPVLLFLTGLAFLNQGDFVQAEKNIRECMLRLPVVVSGPLPIKENQVYQTLGDTHAAKKTWSETPYLYFLALKAQPNYLLPLYKMLAIFREHPNLRLEKFLSFCTPEKKSSLLEKLLKDKNIEAASFIIMSICRDILISDFGIAQILCPKALSALETAYINTQNCDSWRFKTLVLLAKSFLHISCCSTGITFNTNGLREKLWECMKQVFFFR
jgi:hypothetical protein